jgi:hypothetical protein
MNKSNKYSKTKSSNKQYIISSIQDRDCAIYQFLLKLKRLGHIKKCTKPKTLIIFPSKNIKPSPFVYLHTHPQTILAVFREENTSVKVLYLNAIYTTVAIIN